MPAIKNTTRIRLGDTVEFLEFESNRWIQMFTIESLSDINRAKDIFAKNNGLQHRIIRVIAQD